MGVPQTRHRVFFIAIRDDLNIDPFDIDMSFNYEPVKYGEIKDGAGRKVKGEQTKRILNIATHQDKRFIDVFERLGEKPRCFGQKIIWEENVLQTITAKCDYYRGEEKTSISIQDVIHSQTFPEDYQFPQNTWETITYFCGMSVPPIMIKRIVQRLIEKLVFDYAMPM